MEGSVVERRFLAASCPFDSATLAKGARWRRSSNEIGLGSGVETGGRTMLGRSTLGILGVTTLPGA